MPSGELAWGEVKELHIAMYSRISIIPFAPLTLTFSFSHGGSFVGLGSIFVSYDATASSKDSSLLAEAAGSARLKTRISST